MSEFHIIPHNFIYKIFGLDIGPTQLSNFELILLDKNSVQAPHSRSNNPSFVYDEDYVNHTTKLIGNEASFTGYRRIPLLQPKIYTYRLSDFVNSNTYYNWTNSDLIYNQYLGTYYKAFMTGRTVTYVIFDLNPPTVINGNTGYYQNGDISDGNYYFYIGYEDKILYEVTYLVGVGGINLGYSPVSSVVLTFNTQQNTTPAFYWHYNISNPGIENLEFWQDKFIDKRFTKQMPKYLRHMCNLEGGIGPDSKFQLCRWPAGRSPGDAGDVEEIPSLEFRLNTDFEYYTYGKNWDIANNDDFQYPANDSQRVVMNIVDSEDVNFYSYIYQWGINYSVFDIDKTIQQVCEGRGAQFLYSAVNGGGPDCSILYGYRNSIGFYRINGFN